MKQTVLITGATKGIGYATSKKLASLGYNIIGIARHKSDCDFPGELFLADLTSMEQTKNIIAEILKLTIGVAALRGFQPSCASAITLRSMRSSGWRPRSAATLNYFECSNSDTSHTSFY